MDVLSDILAKHDLFETIWVWIIFGGAYFLKYLLELRTKKKEKSEQLQNASPSRKSVRDIVTDMKKQEAASRRQSLFPPIPMDARKSIVPQEQACPGSAEVCMTEIKQNLDRFAQTLKEKSVLPDAEQQAIERLKVGRVTTERKQVSAVNTAPTRLFCGNLKSAILAQEILGKPKALRE